MPCSHRPVSEQGFSLASMQPVRDRSTGQTGHIRQGPDSFLTVDIRSDSQHRTMTDVAGQSQTASFDGSSRRL
jgi:hypothetical protein